MQKKSVLTMVAAAVTAAMSASAYDYTGYIQLQKSDRDGQSSFTNMLDTAYGWNDPVNGKGAAPRPDADYLVTGGKVLRAPFDNTTSTRYKFNGRSLVIDGSSLTLRTEKNASLEFDDLIFRGTSNLDNRGASNDNTIYGKISLDAGATVTATSGGTGHDWYFENEFDSADSAILQVTGGATWVTTEPNKLACLHFDGDCSEFFGTVKVNKRIFVYLDCKDGKFPGKVELSDISTFKIESSTAASSFEVGGITFGDTNCVMSIASGKTLNVGDLVFSGEGVKIEMIGGTLNVTNSLTVTQPVTVPIPSTAAPRTAVLSIPADHPEIPADAFVLVDYADRKTYSLFWITEGNVRTLYILNATEELYNATTGYMPLVSTESSVNNCPPYAFYEAGHWEDATHVPGSVTTNYFVGRSKTLLTPNSSNVEINTFCGACLTLMGIVRVRNGNVTYTFNNLHVLAGSSFSTSGSAGTYFLDGAMHVLAPVDRPFVFQGARKLQTYVCRMDIFGTDNSAIESDAVSTETAIKETDLQLLGDCTGYHGYVFVGTNVTLRLGNTGLANGTVVLRGDNAFLSAMATNSADVMVGTLRSTMAATVTVPETNSISAGAIDVTGALTKNGNGVLAAGGTANAGDGAALSVAAGGLRADSATAFDGIPVTFADGATYVRDCEATDAGLVQYGLYDEAAVTAAGTLNVDIRNFSLGDAGKKEVALFTVPEAGADALAAAIRFSPRPKGLAIDTTVADAGSGMKTVKAVIKMAGMTVIFR